MIGFSEKQTSALRRSLNKGHIRTREVQGRTLSYIEGWRAIAEANRIFGFDGWDRETVESKCVMGRENRGSFHTVYLARVRITVRAEDKTVIREGFGSGEAHGTSAGETHERAIKTAETDATKRALATFGKPFGLELYLSVRPNLTSEIHNPLAGQPPLAEGDRRRTQQRLGPNGRYTVAPRRRITLYPPNTAHMPTAEEVATDQFRGGDVARDLGSAALPEGDLQPAPSPPLQPPQVLEPPPAGPQPAAQVDATATDASPQPDAEATIEPGPEELRLLIDWPKRRREPEHLKYVQGQPCLLCGRTPSDAHHLRFAQRRAFGRKVSDEFTVPLCRVHHRQLHDGGKETEWWAAMDRDIDPLAIAKALWKESRRKHGSGEADQAVPAADRPQASK